MTSVSSYRNLIGKQHLLGHATIDSEHTALAQLWQRAVACEPHELPLHLLRMRRAMEKHFEHEDALMTELGGTLCRHHREEHKRMLALCSEAYALLERDLRKARSILRTAFPKMVRDHIKFMDQCTVLFLHTAQPAACAKA